jgi:hypothetical protein
VPTREPFTALDWIAVALTLMVAMGIVVLVVGIAPAFAGMYADFGAADALPALTRFVLSPAAAALGLVPSALAGAGLRARPIAVRRGFVVVGFLVGLAMLGLCLVGLYMPIFAVTDAVRASP